MPLLNNPPQPIPTAIRNAVTFQDRTAILLNGAGSSKYNPIQSKNPSGLDTTGENGHAFKLKFAMADSSETIDSAVAALANDDGERSGAWTSFKAQITRDTTNYLFSANLVVGEHFPSISSPTTQDGSAQLVLVSIKTNLGRSIHQQVWVAREPSDMVLFGGQTTSASSAYTIVMQSIGGMEASWNVSFFASWNDEIGRQHGASSVALNANIWKPYGGARTVEVRKTTVDGELVQAETNIEDLSTLSHTPSADMEVVKYVFLFRSLEGSSHYLSFPMWVKFTECSSGGGAQSSDSSNNPPEIGNPNAPDDPVIIDGDFEIDVEDLGEAPGSVGPNPDVDIVLTGYKGGYGNNGGSLVPFVDYVGTKTENYTTTGTKTISVDGGIAGSQIVIAEIQAQSGTVLGNSLIYIDETYTDIGTGPDVPQISTSSPAISFNFTTRTVTFGLTANTFPSGAITCKATPVYGGIESGGSALQDTTDLFARTGTSRTSSLSVANSNATGTYNLTFSAWDEANPSGVLLEWYNSVGYADIGAQLVDDGTYSNYSNGVKFFPTITTQSLSTTTVTNDTINFTVSHDGGQVGNFTLEYRIVDSNMATATGSASISSGTGAKSTKLSTTHADIDGYYLIHLKGEQGYSMEVAIDNTGGANTLPA